MNQTIRELNDEELDAVSGACGNGCRGGPYPSTPSKGWVADTVAAIQTIVYGKPS
jgi:hypothetical protein